MAFVLDEKPEWAPHRLKILIGSALVYFLLALPMCCKGGIHLFKVFDSRCSSSLLLLSLIEVITLSAATSSLMDTPQMIMVAWVYGCNRFLDNIEEMFSMSAPVKLFWRAMWTLVSPLVLAVVIILKWVEYEDMEFETSTGDVYVYPAAVQVLGWVFELSPTILTLLYPGWVLYRFDADTLKIDD